MDSSLRVLRSHYCAKKSHLAAGSCDETRVAFFVSSLLIHSCLALFFLFYNKRISYPSNNQQQGHPSHPMRLPGTSLTTTSSPPRGGACSTMTEQRTPHDPPLNPAGTTDKTTCRTATTMDTSLLDDDDEEEAEDIEEDDSADDAAAAGTTTASSTTEDQSNSSLGGCWITLDDEESIVSMLTAATLLVAEVVEKKKKKKARRKKRRKTKAAAAHQPSFRGEGPKKVLSAVQEAAEDEEDADDILSLKNGTSAQSSTTMDSHSTRNNDATINPTTNGKTNNEPPSMVVLTPKRHHPSKMMMTTMDASPSSTVNSDPPPKPHRKRSPSPLGGPRGLTTTRTATTTPTTPLTVPQPLPMLSNTTMPPRLPLTEEDPVLDKGLVVHPPYPPTPPRRRGSLDERAGSSSLPFKRSSTACSKAVKSAKKVGITKTVTALEQEQSRMLEVTTNTTLNDNIHKDRNGSHHHGSGSNKKLFPRSATTVVESQEEGDTVGLHGKNTPLLAPEPPPHQQQPQGGKPQENEDGTCRHLPPSRSLVSPIYQDEKQEKWSMTVGDHTGFTDTTHSSGPFHEEDDLAVVSPCSSGSRSIAATTATTAPKKKKTKRLATFRKKLQTLFRRTPKETAAENTKDMDQKTKSHQVADDFDLPQSPHPPSKPSMVKRVASLSIIMRRSPSKVIVIPPKEVFSKDTRDGMNVAVPVKQGPRFRRATSLTVFPRHNQRSADPYTRDPPLEHKSSSLASSPVPVEYKTFSKNISRDDTVKHVSQYQPVTPSFRRSVSLNPRASSSSTSPTTGCSSDESSMMSPPKRKKSTTTKRHNKPLRKASSLDPGAIEKALRENINDASPPLPSLPKLKKKKSSKKKNNNNKTQELRRALSLNHLSADKSPSNEWQERILPMSSSSPMLNTASRQITRVASLNQLAFDSKPKDEAPLIPQRYNSSVMMKELDLTSMSPAPPIRVDSPPTPKRKNSKRSPSTKFLEIATCPDSHNTSGGSKLNLNLSKQQLRKGSNSVKRLPFEIEMDEDSDIDSDSDLVEPKQGPIRKKGLPAFEIEMDQAALLDVDFDASEMNDVVSPLVSLGDSNTKRRASMSPISKITAPLVLDVGTL